MTAKIACESRSRTLITAHARSVGPWWQTLPCLRSLLSFASPGCMIIKLRKGHRVYMAKVQCLLNVTMQPITTSSEQVSIMKIEWNRWILHFFYRSNPSIQWQSMWQVYHSLFLGAGLTFTFTHSLVSTCCRCGYKNQTPNPSLTPW